MRRRRSSNRLKVVYYLEGMRSDGVTEMKTITRADAQGLIDLYGFAPARKAGRRTWEFPVGMSGSTLLGFGYVSMVVSVMR
jgi:hypothetical protein